VGRCRARIKLLEVASSGVRLLIVALGTLWWCWCVGVGVGGWGGVGVSCPRLHCLCQLHHIFGSSQLQLPCHMSLKGHAA
jgi:hypothetical protein